MSDSPSKPASANVEEALRKAQSLLAAERYASTVVHDINNPLEAAINLAYLLREDADDPTQVRQYALLLDEQLDIMAGITRRALEYYRTPDTMKSVDLVDVVNASIRVHEHKIVAKRLQLQKVFPEAAVVNAYAGELLQVVTNIVANALDALPETGTLSIRVRKYSDEAHILIADNGHGIPAAHLTKVFDPFFTTKGNQGTGLGLSISKSILEKHRGRIRARSSERPGRSGTAFRITLPLDTGADLRAEQTA